MAFASGCHQKRKLLKYLFPICMIFCATLQVSSGAKVLEVVKQMGTVETFIEISSFITDAINHFGSVNCLTVIWDPVLSTTVDYIKFCKNPKEKCPHKYMIQFNGNLSDTLTTALKAGYREKCQSYIILLNRTSAVTDLLHYGDDLRMINTRARFLIWYATVNKAFETDEIWKKLPNVILFRTKLRRRPTKNRRMILYILGLKWPLINASQETTHQIGIWSSNKVSETAIVWYKDKTQDLKNITLRVLVVEHPPSVIKYSFPDGYVEYAGTEIELLKELSLIMNFDFELIDANPVTKWGGQIIDENSTRHFYGAVAKLIYGEVDMAIGSFLILKHYLDYLDMSIPLDVACTSFLTPNPLPRPRYLALILPFRYQLWILVLSICFIFAPVGLYSLTKLALHATEYKIFSQWDSTIFTSFSIMTQVALHLWPKFWPVRMLIGWYWLFCLLITLAYRGAMVSFLTIPLFEQPIDNLDGLAASGLRIGGWGMELRNLFVQKGTVNEQGAKAFLSHRYELVSDHNAGISMVAGGNFAMYENIRYLKFIRATRNLTKVGSPSMRLMKQCVVPVHLGIAYQKNSPIAPAINRHIRRFQESGLMKRWSSRLVTRTKQFNRELSFIESRDADGNSDDEDSSKPNQEEEEEKEEESEDTGGKQERKQRVLALSDLQGPIYLILLGMVVSIGVFAGEILVARTKQSTANMNRELLKAVNYFDNKKTNSPAFEFPIQPVLRSLNPSSSLYQTLYGKNTTRLRKINFAPLQTKKQNFMFEYLE